MLLTPAVSGGSPCAASVALSTVQSLPIEMPGRAWNEPASWMS